MIKIFILILLLICIYLYFTHGREYFSDKSLEDYEKEIDLKKREIQELEDKLKQSGTADLSDPRKSILDSDLKSLSKTN